MVKTVAEGYGGQDGLVSKLVHALGGGGFDGCGVDKIVGEER